MGWDIYRYEDWISVAQAAKAAGVSRQTIHDWIKDGHLKAKRLSERRIMVRTFTLVRHMLRTGRPVNGNDCVPATRAEHERARDFMVKTWKACGSPGKKPRRDGDAVNEIYWRAKADEVRRTKKP